MYDPVDWAVSSSSGGRSGGRSLSCPSVVQCLPAQSDPPEVTSHIITLGEFVCPILSNCGETDWDPALLLVIQSAQVCGAAATKIVVIIIGSQQASRPEKNLINCR